MFKIHLHADESGALLYSYSADILPLVNDVYVDPDKTGNHYIVTRRLLYTSTDMTKAISVWVKKTN